MIKILDLLVDAGKALLDHPGIIWDKVPAGAAGVAVTVVVEVNHCLAQAVFPLNGI